VNGAGGQVTFTGNFERANYNAQYGQLASSNNTALIIAPGPMLNGGVGLAEVSGGIAIGRVNAWGGVLDNRNQNFLGIVSGARNEPDQSFDNRSTPSTISWMPELASHRYRGAGAGSITTAYSVLASEAKSYNGGVSRPVFLDFPAGVTVAFTGNASGGVVLNALDDVVKLGAGTVLLLYSGNTAAGQFATRGNNALIDIRAGNWVVSDVANSSGAFAPIVTDATTGVSDLIFDGGHDSTAPAPATASVQLRDSRRRTGRSPRTSETTMDPGGGADGG
jgi:hypothetical protein